MTTRILLILILTAISPNIFAQSLSEIRISSEAELWNDRTSDEKSMYLEGLCQGLGSSDQLRLGDFMCGKTWAIGEIRRFCFLVNLNHGKDAVAFFDNFYKKKDQSDIPNWAVVASYNDKACKENVVINRLPKMQKKSACIRQASNMMSSPEVSAEALKAQNEYCKTLPR